MAAVVVSLALLSLGLGVLPLPLGLQLGGTGLLVGLGLWLCRPHRSRWGLVVLLPLLLAWGLGPGRPEADDTGAQQEQPQGEASGSLRPRWT